MCYPLHVCAHRKEQDEMKVADKPFLMVAIAPL